MTVKVKSGKNKNETKTKNISSEIITLRKDDNIRIIGARQHNLKIDFLEIPRNKLIVFSGVSGSGKSSLAFDTIFAEGQRRYMESLSSYARQFLGQMQKPKVESIEGLSPAISIEQKTVSKNPRSTVATISELYDYLRLLYARIGLIHCYKCGNEIKKQTISDIIDRVLNYPKNLKLMLLAPIVSGRKGEFKSTFLNLKKEGYARVRIDKIIYDLDDLPVLNKNQKHSIEVVIDRLKTQSLTKTRVSDSVEQSLLLGEGLMIVSSQEQGNEETIDQLFSLNFACIEDDVNFEELEPKMFSFNSPFGACPECDGLGERLEVDPELCLNLSLSMREGAITGRPLKEGSWRYSFWKKFADFFGYDIDTPLKNLPKTFIKSILFGTDERIVVKHERADSSFSATYEHEWSPEGVVNTIKRRWLETSSEEMRKYYEKFMIQRHCDFCNANRLHPKYQTVFIGNKGITEISDMTVDQTSRFFERLKLNDRESQIANEILKEIKSRLGFLKSVGLSYLSLNRKANTLSGGESQRIRLATQVGSALVGVLYVLDEPTIGLHERDKERLVGTLKALRDIGNTVLVVEHDEHTLRAADYIVDLGPKAGKNGGKVIAVGKLNEVKKNPKSITGKFLSGKLIVKKNGRSLLPNDNYLKIYGASQHNLKNINVNFPLGLFVVVTGVSGSGKSTLINQILYKVLAKHFYRSLDIPGNHKSVEGLEKLDKVILVDQSPIGRTPRSNPATYTKVFDPIRDIFSKTRDSRLRGYKKGRFSFNVKGGRCEGCNGDGEVKIEMFFLPNVYIPCEKCKGARYNRETLEIRYKENNIAEVLDMTVEEAYEFGQPAPTLSGGEAQRIKLAKELGRSARNANKTLYLLDEPTTGLHSADVQHLMNVLFKLRDRGNSIILIEHNLDVIRLADWIIDLGPEGGFKGGEVVATGPPKEIMKNINSYTGLYLKKYVKNY
ncbi:MAG: excinuclease ABC subunit UvrA [Candidatus Hodarchaeales archaeon]|jgi:excinuclease ABC subunit A